MPTPSSLAEGTVLPRSSSISYPFSALAIPVLKIRSLTRAHLCKFVRRAIFRRHPTSGRPFRTMNLSGLQESDNTSSSTTI